MPSFKTDESFLEKISIGAIGTQQVFKALSQLGHKPIELERGSMNYKIWKKIKIKRIRVPDILCVDNGIRVESRAKTKLEISMSHSISDPDRGWDFGMKDDDYVALVVCKKSGTRPIDWKAGDLVQFVNVKDLREAVQNDQINLIRPKGAQEGFERRIIWVSAVASSNGVVTAIDQSVIKYKTDNGRINFIKLNKGGKVLKPLVQVGEMVLSNQIIASVVPVERNIPDNKVNADYFLANLSNLILSERYAAVKALTFFKEERVILALSKKLDDNDEHIYVKLEAAASLARFGEEAGYTFITKHLKNLYLQHVLETVIVLNEIKSDRACEILCNILTDDSFDSEIRAAAAWGLGEQQNPSAIRSILESFNYINETIKIEAARALSKLTQNYNEDILIAFSTANSNEKPGIAWALSKSTRLSVDQVVAHLRDLDSRQWMSYIIGMHGEEQYIKEIEKIKDKDPEVYFAVTLLWKLMTSWVYELKEY